MEVEEVRRGSSEFFFISVLLLVLNQKYKKVVVKCPVLTSLQRDKLKKKKRQIDREIRTPGATEMHQKHLNKVTKLGSWGK